MKNENSEFYTLKGIRRKINTKIPKETLTDIKNTINEINGKNKNSLMFLSEQMKYGSIKSIDGRNINKQFNRIKELHSERLKK